MVAVTFNIGETNAALYAKWQSLNSSPKLNDIGTVSGEEGKQISIVLTDSDPDGDKLIYSSSALPLGANFDPDSGILNGCQIISSQETIM